MSEQAPNTNEQESKSANLYEGLDNATLAAIAEARDSIDEESATKTLDLRSKVREILENSGVGGTFKRAYNMNNGELNTFVDGAAAEQTGRRVAEVQSIIDAYDSSDSFADRRTAIREALIAAGHEDAFKRIYNMNNLELTNFVDAVRREHQDLTVPGEAEALEGAYDEYEKQEGTPYDVDKDRVKDAELAREMAVDKENISKVNEPLDAARGPEKDGLDNPLDDEIDDGPVLESNGGFADSDTKPNDDHYGSPESAGFANNPDDPEEPYFFENPKPNDGFADTEDIHSKDHEINHPSIEKDRLSNRARARMNFMFANGKEWFNNQSRTNKVLMVLGVVAAVGTTIALAKHGLSHDGVPGADGSTGSGSGSKNLGDFAGTTDGSSTAAGAPDLLPSSTSHAHPFGWAEEVFGSKNAMSSLHELGDKAAHAGHDVQWHGSGTHQWVEVDGNSKTAHVIDVFRQFAK